MCPDRIDGSPQTEACSNMDSRRSATSPSSREEVKSVDPVPFYLIPQALAREMQQYGDAISGDVRPPDPRARLSDHAGHAG